MPQSLKKPASNKTKAAPIAAASADGARLVMNGDGVVLFATPEFSALLGDGHPDPVGRAFGAVFEFRDPEDSFHAASLFGAARADAPASQISAVREGSHAVIINGQGADLHFDHIRLPDGRRYVVASHGDTTVPSTWATRIAEIEQARRPATERPESTLPRGTSGADMKHFLNMSHDMLSVSDAGGRFHRLNSSFSTVLGYSEKALQSMNFLDLVHPDDKPQVRGTFAALMYDDAPQNEIVDFETRLVTQSGHTRWMEWRHKRNDDMIYSVGRDITAFKEHEETLKQQGAMLREAQSIGHMGHWRWVVGSNDIQWSDEIYNIFGVTRDQFKPALDALNQVTHKRDVGRLIQAFQRAIIEQNDYDMEFRIVRPAGETRYIRCEGRCEKDESGDVIALFGIMQDVTERTIYEKNLTEAKEAAERAYSAKSQFLANMSHELRTPLNAIIGFSEMMQRQLLGPIGSDRYLDYIAGIRQSGEHLLDLIADILDMSKIEAGKYELDLEELNVSKVIRLGVHMMEGRATEAKINIGIDIVNEDLQIVADRRALMQVLLNLLSNAVKFTEPGGSVRIESVEREDYLSIKVHDTGIGIPANQLKNITRPFEQAASHYTRKHEGTGLGLAITKELIELHGGSLHIESTVGVGTTVTVRMPYSAADAIKKKGKK